MLIFAAHVESADQTQDGLVVDENIAFGWTRDGLSDAFVHDLRRQIISPTRNAKDMATFETSHVAGRSC